MDGGGEELAIEGSVWGLRWKSSGMVMVGDGDTALEGLSLLSDDWSADLNLGGDKRNGGDEETSACELLSINSSRMSKFWEFDSRSCSGSGKADDKGGEDSSMATDCRSSFWEVKSEPSGGTEGTFEFWLTSCILSIWLGVEFWEGSEKDKAECNLNPVSVSALPGSGGNDNADWNREGVTTETLELESPKGIVDANLGSGLVLPACDSLVSMDNSVRLIEDVEFMLGSWASSFSLAFSLFWEDVVFEGWYSDDADWKIKGSLSVVEVASSDNDDADWNKDDLKTDFSLTCEESRFNNGETKVDGGGRRSGVRKLPFSGTEEVDVWVGVRESNEAAETIKNAPLESGGREMFSWFSLSAWRWVNYG